MVNGHNKYPEPTASSNYAGVVYRESVRVVLPYAVLHDVDVLSTNKKHCITCGAEFGL